MTEILRDLGSGLILRRSTMDDKDALADFNARIHGDDENERQALAAWTRDLMGGEHPTFGVGDFTIVEDTSDGKIVSAVCLISQKWTYDGIAFGVGQPELVGTLPEYRRRGLIGEQMQIIHAWSQERGELVNGITGIPYYYRRFGYEMAMNLEGGRVGYEPNLIELKEGETEPYTLRQARQTDLPLISQLYAVGAKRWLVAVRWEMAQWQYELNGKESLDVNRRLLFIIEDENHIPVGFAAVPSVKWRNTTVVTAYELLPGVSWFKVTPSLVRWLWQLGIEQAKEQNYTQTAFGFWLGKEHPAYTAYADQLPKVREPYAWYLRVPNLVQFLRVIKPALEAHLEGSLVKHYSGELKLSFYHDGVGMLLEKGKITDIHKLSGDADLKECSIEFPGLTFLQALFGWRDVDEISYLFPDCRWRSSEVKTLVGALFPKKNSNLWPIA